MKKSIYILISALILIIVVFVLFWLNRSRNDVKNVNQTNTDVINNEIIVPIFMTDIEKKSLGLSPDAQVQVLNRADSGEIMMYKIIRSNEDLITNRKQLQVR